MITCDSCQTTNAPEANFCENCGAPLKVSAAEAEVAAEPAGAVEQPAPVEPLPAPPPTPPPAAEPPQGTPDLGSMTMVSGAPAPPQIDADVAASVKAYLVIERGTNVGVKFALTDKDSLIGRWDADNGIFPEIDLDRFDPEAKVSRRHAKIYFKDGQYVIEDIGSTNGTFLNRGRRLLPGVPQVLSNDDEIIVGKTFLRFRIG